MADNYLERQKEEYERRKAMWLLRRRNIKKPASRNISKPEDEAL